MKNGWLADRAGFVHGFAIAGLALAALSAASPAQAQDAVEPSGDGTAGNPFQITQMGHLVWMAATVDASAGKHYSLLNDIDASDTTNWNAGAGFSPIGDNAVPFLGILNGNGNAIRHLVINRPSENEVGLIGFMESPALVRDLRLENGTVAASSYVGGLVGWINRGTVSNCTATGSTEANTTVGGLAGYNNEGTISLCSFTGTVSGVNIVGGLVGENNGPITDCSAASQVTGGDRAGGLAGINLSTVENSRATGSVAGVSYIGGLIGRSSFGSIAGCSAAGDVAGLESAGGLVGYLYNGSLNACRASGSVMVSGTGWGAGGLVGYSTGSSLADCHATGPVTGRDGCGGLVGYNNNGSASRCFAAGAVTGSDYVGGLMGYNGGSPVGDCYATGDVTGTSDNVGGLVGFNHYTTVARCYASGFVTGSTWAGGLVGGNNGTVLASYWDTNTTGKIYSGGGAGMSTEDMMQQATFAGWDFTSMWQITENETYPTFTPPPEPTIIGVSGNLAFGNVVTGQTASATLIITNNGNTELTVTSITYPEGFSGDWSGSIPAGGSQDVTVIFSPAALQDYGGTVTVESDADEGENTIEASGTGVPVPPPGQLCFSASTYAAQEGIKCKVMVRRVNGSNGTVSVTYVMKAKTAVAGKDFIATSAPLVWADGDTLPKAIKITIPVDGKIEGIETFQVVLKNPVRATVVAPNKTIVSIKANQK